MTSRVIFNLFLVTGSEKSLTLPIAVHFSMMRLATPEYDFFCPLSIRLTTTSRLPTISIINSFLNVHGEAFSIGTTGDPLLNCNSAEETASLALTMKVALLHCFSLAVGRIWMLLNTPSAIGA